MRGRACAGGQDLDHGMAMAGLGHVAEADLEQWWIWIMVQCVEVEVSQAESIGQMASRVERMTTIANQMRLKSFTAEQKTIVADQARL